MQRVERIEDLDVRGFYAQSIVRMGAFGSASNLFPLPGNEVAKGILSSCFFASGTLTMPRP
jgi:hypothetical protein